MRAALAATAAFVLLAATAAAAPEAQRRPGIAVGLLELRGLEPARTRAVESLLSAAARRTAVEMAPTPVVRVRPGDPALFDHPLVVLAGASDFAPLSDDELDAMRSYLSLGGMVLVDDRSGTADSPFARRARAELSRAVGGREPVALPSDHALFRAYYLLDRPWGRFDVDDELTALVLEGRAAVVFSPNDAVGAWERDELGNWVADVTPGGTRQREMALRFGVNLLLYALTLDYKQDLVHLPLILERRR